MSCLIDMMTNRFHIVPWVSYREYLLSGETKILLYEQKTQFYYLLSGKAVEELKKLAAMQITAENEIPNLRVLIDDGVVMRQKSECCHVNNNESSMSIEKYGNIPESLNEAIKAEGYIFDAHWDITNKCNERCIHCYNVNAHNGLRNIQTEELSYDEAKSLVDELVYLGVFRLVLSGGEVLTNPFFVQLCQYIRKQRIELIIYTNGLAFTKKLLDELSKVYPSVVCFSVYGHNKTIHDGVTRVRGSYDKVLSALSYLKEREIQTCHKNTLLLFNYQWWRETLRKGARISDKSLVNCTIYPSLDGNGLSQYRLTESQLIEIANCPDSPIYYKHKIKGVCSIFKPKDKTPCYSKTNTIYINPKGEICLCIAFQCVVASLREGNIRELKRKQNLTVYVNDFTQLNGCERLDNWRSLRISDLKECGQYDYCEFCIDVCPGDAFLLTGDLLSAPNNHCMIAKARHKAYLLKEKK